MIKNIIFFFTMFIFNCYGQLDLKKMISNCENDSVCFYLFTNNSWNTQSRYINFSYSSDSTLLSNDYQTLNYGVWLNQSKNIVQVDNDLKTFTEINKKWNGYTWIDSIKTIIYYDSLGKDTLSITSSWNNNWENNLMYSYRYNSNNQLIEEVQYNWDGLTWVKNTKISNEYDSIDNLLSIKNYDWLNNNWLLKSQTSNTYNTFNQLILEIFENFSSSSNNNYKNEFTYTSNKLSMKINFTNLQNNWIPQTKSIYGYDLNGIKQNEYIYLKNSTNTWDISYNIDYEFINSDTIEYYKRWNGISWITEKINKYLFYDNSCIKSFEFIYYDSTGTNISSQEKIYFYPRNQLKQYNFESDITIFPNPSNGQFNIVSKSSLNSIVLIDTYGNKTSICSPSKNTFNYSIDTTIYKTGIYFLKIKTNDGFDTIKKIEIIN